MEKTDEEAEKPPLLVMQPTKIFCIPSEPSDTHTSSQQTTENGYTKIEIPLDIVMSLLRPDELEKLRKYIASYLGRHWR